MAWTYRLRADGKSFDPTQVHDKDAILEWLITALSTVRGEQPYLPDKFGLDMTQIIHGNNPTLALQQSIREICGLRKGITLVSCRCWQEGRNLYASIQCRTIFGDIRLGAMHLATVPE